MEEQLDDVLVQERLIAALAGFFAALAVPLACLGLYGVISYTAARRTNEIGIRLAMGATRDTLAATRRVSAKLFGIGPGDPLTITAAAGLLISVALLAGFLPARRASRVHPMVAPSPQAHCACDRIFAALAGTRCENLRPGGTMARQRSLASLMLLAAALCGCSRDTPPPATQTAAQPPAASPAAPTPAPTPAAPPTTPALKTGDTNITGVAAEVTQCDRKDGVLSVKVRFRNTSSQKQQFNLIDTRDYEKFYLTAASKKYFILKDSEGTYLTPQASGFGNLAVSLDPAELYTWWAKYPAPPPEVKAVTLYMPVAAPFEDIPVSDK